jgi:hypothetical protein
MWLLLILQTGGSDIQRHGRVVSVGISSNWWMDSKTFIYIFAVGKYTCHTG